jgi:hypothetical protein
VSLTAHVASFAAVAFVVTSVGCDSVFRFDQPATSAKDGGGTDEAGGDAGSPLPCGDDATCGEGLRCEVSSGMCVACLGDTDCSGSRGKCDVARGICVECNGTTDCPQKEGCNLATKRCLDVCDGDDLCPVSGFSCVGTVCAECTKSENCNGSPTGPLCDKSIGRCVECTGNAQCPSSKPVCDRRSGRCVACVTSSECGMGSVCDPVALTCRLLP